MAKVFLPSAIIQLLADIMTQLATSTHSKDHPFPAVLRENRLLNGPGSAKETRHFVIDIEGSGITYLAGDSLGVFPANDPRHVEEVIRALGATGDEPVILPKTDEPLPLREALFGRLSLAGPSRKTLEAFAGRVTDERERERLEELLRPESRVVMMEFLSHRELIDLLEEFPSARFAPAEIVEHLRRLVPRLYSLASSPVCHPREVHLTVAVVRYRTNERDRLGVCSTWLAERVPLYQPVVPVFMSHSHFGLPEDESRDIIMVGPGTGVAPFRAFVQERAAKGSPGRNWLFFGDQRRETDYLYGDEFEDYHRRGVLQRLDLAFSRDQTEKIYVQHRMLENAAELWSWIDGGGMFYVCGDAQRMAKDVDAALHEVIRRGGNLDEEAAAEYVKQMKRDKRYLRDVY